MLDAFGEGGDADARRSTACLLDHPQRTRRYADDDALEAGAQRECRYQPGVQSAQDSLIDLASGGDNVAGIRRQDRLRLQLLDRFRKRIVSLDGTDSSDAEGHDLNLSLVVVVKAFRQHRYAVITHVGAALLHSRRRGQVCGSADRQREWDWRPDNAAKGIPRYPEDRRETWLTGEQVEDLLAALDAYTDQSAANAIRLLIVTGAREGEVLSATWDQFDIKRGIWTKPSHHTRNRKRSSTRR